MENMFFFSYLIVYLGLYTFEKKYFVYLLEEDYEMP